jgi:hypothetical protein
MSRTYRILKSLNTISAFVLGLLFAGVSLAQNPAARYEIDAKRIGVTPYDKDALPRGREFLRLDSTYYVGWLYQGVYLHDRSVDQQGYQRCLAFLRNAFTLIEKDYSGLLKNLYSTPMYYMQNNQRYNDYLVLASKLREAYEYLEMPDSAIWVLQQVDKKNFRRDFFGTAGLKAWVIHRNRFYNHQKFAFLANSVAENEQLALRACYSGLGRIQRNLAQNNLWFGEGHSSFDRLSVYHYLALLHCYQKNYDSSEYYYEQMQSMGSVSYNNYGSMKAEIGDFGEAIDFYGRDKYKYGGVKSLMEPYYYLPTLYVYSGRTVEAIKTAKEAIELSNSSPGFGWYNIALARSYLYNGQLDSADITLKKAAAFKEIHIGTTLTQPQYDFSIGLLRLMWYHKQIDLIKFFDRGWWYKPASLYAMAEMQAQKYAHEYLLATQLALNPERARIIYDLFCGESTVGYDEIWYLMKRYSPRYFMKLMTDYIDNDPRSKIKKYFQLYEARLNWEAGKRQPAQDKLEALLNDVRLDTAHEKLFLGRLYEGLALSYNSTADASKQNNMITNALEQYPQLLPFSNLPIAMHLQVNGQQDALTEKVITELKNCNINWQNTTTGAAEATVTFKKKGIKYEAELRMRSASGKTIVFGERFLFKEAEGAGKEIALRLFGKTGAQELEAPPKKPA